MRLRLPWFVLPHALATALLVALPLLLFPILAGDASRGINIAHFGTDQHFYLTRARDVLDGYGLGNSILREGKDGGDPYFTWNERVLLAPYRWLGVAESINAATLYTVMNAVGIFVLVFLIYALAFQLTGDKLVSATIAVFVICGSALVFSRRFFMADMNVYGRAMTPYLSSLGLFVYLNLLVRSLVRPRPRTLAFTAVALGALFYMYLYAWSYAVTLHGLMLLIFLLKRDREKAKTLAITLAGGLLLGAYNLFQLFGALFSEAHQALRYVHYVEHTRALLWSNVGFVLLILFFAYRRKFPKDERLPIFLAVILAGWVVVNQQVLTGLRLQPGHFYWYFIVPLGIMLGILMAWSFLKRPWRTWFCIALLAAAYVNTAVGQYRATLSSMSVKLDEQRFAAALASLREDRRPSAVLAAPDDRAYLVLIYTPHDLFWHPASTYYAAERARMTQALSVFLLLDPKARKDVSAFLRDAVNDAADPYGLTYRALEGFTSGLTFPEYEREAPHPSPALERHRQTILAELTREVDRLAADPAALRGLLDGHGVRYAVWDEKAYPDWDLSVIPGLREVVSSGGVRMYRLE